MEKLELLKQMKLYIEQSEKLYDGEFGQCRELEELIEDKEMPTIYNVILEEIDKAEKESKHL